MCLQSANVCAPELCGQEQQVLSQLFFIWFTALFCHALFIILNCGWDNSWFVKVQRLNPDKLQLLPVMNTTHMAKITMRSLPAWRPAGFSRNSEAEGRSGLGQRLRSVSHPTSLSVSSSRKKYAGRNFYSSIPVTAGILGGLWSKKHSKTWSPQVPLMKLCWSFVTSQAKHGMVQQSHSFPPH